MSKEAAPVEGEAPKKKGKLMVIIIAVVAVVVLAGGGVAAWLLMSKPDKAKKAKDHGEEDVAADEEGHGDGEGDGEEEDADAEHGDEHPPVYEKLEQFTVNLSGGESYLQTEVQLLVATPEVQAKIKAHMPEIRNDLIEVLSSKTAEELGTLEGKKAMAEEVKKKVNAVIGAKKASKGVKKVLFGSFIIQ